MKSPHYTPTHIFPSEAIALCCLSFASLYWEEASSAARRSKVPSLCPSSAGLFTALPQLLQWDMLSLPGSPPWGRSIGETLFSPQKTGAIREETQQKIQIWYRVHFTDSYKKGCWGYLGMLTNLKIALLSTLKKTKAVIIFKRKKKIIYYLIVCGLILR